MKIVNSFEPNEIINADCFDVLPSIPDESVDMILTDLPYGTTQCKWDSILPLDKMWEQLNRVIKPNGAIVLFASQPFTSILIASNLTNFKYTWVWEKSKATNYLNAKKQPLRASEDICVFYKKQPTYNPQMTQGVPYNKGTALRETEVYGSQTAVEVKSDGERYPRNVIYFKTAETEGKLHPTQKPIALLEYLIKTYTNEGDLVLDITAGSFSTAHAAINTKRNWIGIEKDTEYCQTALKRMSNIDHKEEETRVVELFVPKPEKKPQSSLTKNQEAVLQVLMDNKDKDFSAAELATLTGLSARTCSSSISPLCVAGVAEKTNSKSPYRIKAIEKVS